MSVHKKQCPIDGGTCGQGGTCFVCENEALGSQFLAAEARIAELEKALEPFADWYEQPPGKFDPVTADHCATGIIVRVGDLRRAAAMLKEKE